MSLPINEIVQSDAEYPSLLKEIPDVPERIYYRGILPSLHTKCLAVVGSRNYTTYGKQVVEHLISELRGYPISIISGLALGIDSLAHSAALDAGLYTLAVPGSGLDDNVIYPARHKGLASKIVSNGGCLLSEFEPSFKATTWSFPQRNRIMVGLSHATLVIEATEKSGTLITARLTADYNRELLVVPGNIFNDGSKGPHQFLKLGATPATSAEDILSALNITEKISHTETPDTNLTEEESGVLKLLSVPCDRDELIRMLHTDTSAVNILLMHMELKGLITTEQDTIRKTI